MSLQTHYKSRRVFKLTLCCPFSPSDMLILQLFFLVSPVSTASWQGILLHVIGGRQNDMIIIWKWIV